nr:MFS transporter [Actinopolyspora biskrensis]
MPDIASGLGVSAGTAGLAASAFAVGMILGAPLMAGITRRWSARSSLLGFVLVFAAAHVVGALTSSFPVLLGTRVVAAVANAGFLAVALATASALMAPDREGTRSGGAAVGHDGGRHRRGSRWGGAGHRAGLASRLLGDRPAAPARGPRCRAGGSGPSLRTEIVQLARPRLVLVMVLAGLVNAATFGSFTFLTPIVTGTAGLAELWVPVVLVLFGIGSSLGVRVAGRLPDRRPGQLVATGGRWCCSAGSCWPPWPLIRSRCWFWCSFRGCSPSRWAAP